MAILPPLKKLRENSLVVKKGDVYSLSPLIDSRYNAVYGKSPERFRKSKKVSGISSVFHPIYPSLFLDFAKKGMNVSILVTLPVYKRITEEFTTELSEFI